MNFFKKAISFALAAIMLTGTVSIAASAQTTTENTGIAAYKGVYYYRPGTGEYLPGTDSVDYYVYSDDLFKTSGKEYNPNLSTLSMSLAESSVNSTREPFTDEGYAKKNRNAIAFLEDNGFGDIEINDDYKIKPTKDTMGIGCAHKTVTDDGKDYTLLVIMPRNAGYEAEWGNNFVLGADGDATGFDHCSDTCLEFTNDYVKKHNISGDIKVWTIGYSRGAAVANIIAKKLIDNPNAYLGDDVNLETDNLYAYTFGTPSAADEDNSPRAEKYAGIFNSYENTELASAMAPQAMGFERYGTDRMIIKPETYDDMLANLEIKNKYVHDTFESSINSKYYVPKKISVADGSIGLADDNNSYIPTDPAEYLVGLGQHLNNVVGGRAEYAKTYEQPFSDLFSYYESLTGDNATAFTSSLTSNDDSIILVVGMYAYFMKSKINDNIKMSKEIANAKAKELAALTVGADGDAEEGGNSKISAGLIAKVASKLVVYLLEEPEYIKKDTAKYLSSVLDAAMRASGATNEQIAAVTNQKASQALVHLISNLLLGNIWQSDSVHPLMLNNEQIKNAATLIGNAANLFVDHANEIILSWLRTEDNWFTDYATLTDAQLAGYRRVYVNSGEAAVNGTILDENDEVIAVIENGAVTSSKDRWIGYTTSDKGGFFRIPCDKDYAIKLHPSADADTAVKIGEYNPYTAETKMLLEESVAAKSGDTVTIMLPALKAEYEMPSTAEYSVTIDSAGYILGDANGDGIVDINDVTHIQKHIAGQSLTVFVEEAADINGDGKVSVLDATLIQKYIAGYSLEYSIGAAA